MLGRERIVAVVSGGAFLALATIGQAQALPVFTIAAAPGGTPTGNTYVDFNDLPIGNTGGSSGGIGVSFTPASPPFYSGSSFSGGQAITGHTGIYAPPFISNNNDALFGGSQGYGEDSTIYLTTGIHSVILTFSSDLTYLGLLWGSVDNYNTLTFYDDGSAIGSITGTQVWAAANGNQGALGTYYANINITGGVFDKVIATSTRYAFEFDNVSYNEPPPGGLEPIPEPSTIAILGAALLGLGVLRRRRKAKT